MVKVGVPAGEVSTLAGSSADFEDGADGTARFNNPADVAVDDEGCVYVCENSNHRIRRRSPEGQWTTLAGSGNSGYADGQGSAAHFKSPWGIAVGPEGTLYVSDRSNHRIRKVTREGVVSTLAGSGVCQFADGQGTAASFHSPWGIAVDADGNVYVADQSNHRIRKITPQGVVSTFAGSGLCKHGDGQGTGHVVGAHFSDPAGLAMGSDGVLYVAEVNGNCIRKITPDGAVSTVAGSRAGSGGFADGQGAVAHFSNLRGLAVDAEGVLFVCDYSNHRIRKITPDGVVSTLAGAGIAAFADSHGAAAQFSGPQGLAIDHAGDLLVADYSNHRIRRVGAEAAPLLGGGGAALPEVPSSYAEDMRQMLASPALSDVTFIVEGTKLTAHRCLLVARGGEYFSRLLTGEFREAEPGAEIPIEGHTAAGFRALLEYLYTDELAFPDESVIDVMRLAHAYRLDRPYNHCVRHCRRQINTANAVGWFIEANQYGLDDLRDSTFKFVSRNFRKIRTEHKDSLRQLGQYPELMMEVMMEAL